MATALQPSIPATPSTAMLIGGRLHPGLGGSLTPVNPSSGRPIATFAGASLDQFHQAVAAARTAFDKGDWPALRPSDRVAVLRRFLALLVERADELKALIVTETGVPIGSFVYLAQVDSPLRQMAAMLDLYLQLPDIEDNPITLDERVNPMGGFVQSIRRHVPLGVCAAISAYNVPMHIALWKVFPALATGNSVILRPNPLTPLSALWLAEVASDAGLPDGILNILAETGAEGATLLTTHIDVDLVSFTGSTAIGKKVAEQAAATMKRVHLELGGKSAQIFLPDRVEAAFGAAASICTSHAGQGCVLGTRIFVPMADKPPVLERMKASLEAIRIGDSADPATMMGPLINEAQVERCAHYVQLAVAAGATIVTGGHRVERTGFYFEPTVLDLPDNGNPAAQDEIFGPVIGVIGYRDLDHAVEMANDSRFGLSGYVHGKDARVALDIARRLRTGTVNVNAFMASANASSGGHKESGLGRERGVEGIRAFQQVQVLNLGTAS